MADLHKRSWAAVCYFPFLGFIPAIVFLIIEKEPEVRFNAVQSLLTFAAWFALSMLPVLGGLATIGFFVLWLLMVVKVYQGEGLRLPMLAEWTDKILKKV